MNANVGLLSCFRHLNKLSNLTLHAGLLSCLNKLSNLTLYVGLLSCLNKLSNLTLHVGLLNCFRYLNECNRIHLQQTKKQKKE